MSTEVLNESKENKDIRIKKNKKFLEYINNTDFNNLDLESTEVDLYKSFSDISKDIEVNSETNKQTIEKSKLRNILNEKQDDTYKYDCSGTFDFLKEYDLIRNGFYVIAGYSSSGKTSFSIQLALDLLTNNKNTKLLVYSMDDSIPFITSKLIKQLLDKNEKHSDKISTIAPTQTKTLYELSKNIDDSIIDRIHIFENLNIFDNYNTKTINDHIESIKKKDNSQIIVVIDYLQVIDAKGNDVRTALNEVCKQLKNIQKEHDCMMLSLSQLSNDGNYRETSEIRNIADVIIKQYSKHEYLKKEPNKNECMDFIFSVEKNKSGIKGMMYEAKINSNFCFYGFQNYNKKDSGKRETETQQTYTEYIPTTFNEDMIESQAGEVDLYHSLESNGTISMSAYMLEHPEEFEGDYEEHLKKVSTTNDLINNFFGNETENYGFADLSNLDKPKEKKNRKK